jgi:hypothetical protein
MMHNNNTNEVLSRTRQLNPRMPGHQHQSYASNPLGQSTSTNGQQQHPYSNISSSMLNIYPNPFMVPGQQTFVSTNYMQQQPQHHQKQQQHQQYNNYNNNSKFNKLKTKPYHSSNNYNSNKNQSMYKFKANQTITANQPSKFSSLSPLSSQQISNRPNEVDPTSLSGMFFLQIHDFKTGLNRNELHNKLSDSGNVGEIGYYEKTSTNQLIKLNDMVNDDLSVLNKNENAFVLLQFPNMECLNSFYNLFNATSEANSIYEQSQVDADVVDNQHKDYQNADKSNNLKTFFKLKYFSHNDFFL